MYRLYKESCLEKSIPAQKESMYRKIFNRDSNLHFFVPKKDQCDFCTEYKNTSRKSQTIEIKYAQHCAQKVLARNAKEAAKKIAQDDKKCMAACFDLEKILNCPHGQASSYYYHRKLSMYNLTAYCLGTGDAYCFLWDETDAKRGCNEIASCLLKFVKIHMQKNCKSFCFFSDNCAGQNINRFIAALWWYVIKEFGVNDVTHSFLEVGHTQNENDSVHATIERASRRTSLYTPDQWSAVIGTARAEKPYVVIQMELEDFFDFKKMASSIRNFEVDEDGHKVKWTQIRAMEFSNQHPNTMFIRYRYDKDAKCVNLMTSRRNMRQRITEKPQLKQLRTTSIPLSAAKFADLMKLCDKQLIPPRHQHFYKNLPHE
jgi:hypothetical protein